MRAAYDVLHRLNPKSYLISVPGSPGKIRYFHPMERGRGEEAFSQCLRPIYTVLLDTDRPFKAFRNVRTADEQRFAVLLCKTVALGIRDWVVL